MAAATPMIIPRTAQEGIVQYHKACYSMLIQHWNIREQMRQVDLAYIRENDWTDAHRMAQLANKWGDPTKLQNVVVPVVMPQVETALTYQASVFLSGNPMFGVVADPNYMDAASQMEAIIADQQIRGGWIREALLFIRDGLKYNFNAMEVDWVQDVTAALDTDLSFDSKMAKPKEVIWEGNRLKRLDPYNVMFDTRVTPAEMHRKGEFVGYTELMGRVALKDFINKLPTKMVDNVAHAFESGPGGDAYETYYIPRINPDAMLNKDIKASTDWMAWANITNSNPKIAYRNLYEVTTLYGRIIPSDFGLRVPSPNTPQVWKFIIINNQVLIYAERQTNAHGYLPILMGQPLEDGLMYQTKSFANNIKPIQEISTGMLNSAIQARRRAISDRTLYDPTRVREADINSPNPSAKIPVRPAAYGKPLNEAVYPFPYRDDQSGTIFQEINQMDQWANKIAGQNQAQQGQFVKGNKTLHEYADVMGNAGGRNQMIAMLLEAQVFTPMKEIIKLNILQYQGGTSLYNPNTQQVTKIDPVVLRKAVVNFKVSDGLTPSDKLINSDAFSTALQTIGNSPAIGSGYNIAPLFSYLMKTQGADLKSFEKPPQQLAFEQAMSQWQQMAQLAMQKGAQFSTPQPTPQQYGYNPAQPQQPVDPNPPSIIQQVMQMNGTGGAQNGAPSTGASTGGTNANQQAAAASAPPPQGS
jgi:hypothetical protein